MARTPLEKEIRALYGLFENKKTKQKKAVVTLFKSEFVFEKLKLFNNGFKLINTQSIDFKDLNKSLFGNQKKKKKR